MKILPEDVALLRELNLRKQLAESVLREHVACSLLRAHSIDVVSIDESTGAVTSAPTQDKAGQ